MAIATELEGPEWQVFAEAFYDLMETEFEDAEAIPVFDDEIECCFREDPEDEDVFQVILSTGSAIELRPDDNGDKYSVVNSEADFAAVSAIYGRLIKALEEERPDLKADIALVDIPTAGNGFLRDTDGNAFRGAFHLKSNPDEKFSFVVDVIDIPTDKLKATAAKCEKLLLAVEKMQMLTAEVQTMHASVLEKQLKDANNKIAELTAKLENMTLEEPEPEDPTLVKAQTIAIFDSILFAIENWSTDGDTAPDFSLACQAILFDLVYAQVMKGNSDYYLRKVPDAALEVVKRGREYVKFIRDTCQVGLTDSTAWSQYVPMISMWWVNDALPLLYGARDDTWSKSTPLSLESIISWRDQPASRALDFPLVFDAMDLIDRHGEEIRSRTDLPQFTLDTLNTRLKAN